MPENVCKECGAEIEIVCRTCGEVFERTVEGINHYLKTNHLYETRAIHAPTIRSSE